MSMPLSASLGRLGEVFGSAPPPSPSSRGSESYIAQTTSTDLGRLNEVSGSTAMPISSLSPRGNESEIAKIMQNVLDAKQAHKEKILKDKSERLITALLIGGDVFTTGYLGFQGVQALVPSIQSMAAVGTATLVCGELAGAINIVVGIICFVQACKAFKSGDKELGVRLMFDFVFSTAIGLVMILASLAIKVGALAGIGAFLAANPWLLPVLFFVVTLPLICELSRKIGKIALGQDLGSKLQLAQLPMLLSKDLDWTKIKSLYQGTQIDLTALEKCSTERELLKKLGGKHGIMQQLQADMGVEAAMETFKLLMFIQKQNREKVLDQIEVVNKKLAEWKRALYVRMFQQVLYTAGFAVSMAGLSPKVDANLLNGVQNIALAGANAIPFYMDTFWLFKRNAPLVVPKVVSKQALVSPD